MEPLVPYVTLTLILCLCTVPSSGGSVYFVDTQIVASEGNQFSLRVGYLGTITQIVNAIVWVDNINQDFVGSSQIASFAPGGPLFSNVTFTVTDDNEPEIEETYQFTLSVIGTGTTVTVPNIATVIIQANDDAYGVFSIADVSPILTREDPVSTNIVNVRVERTLGTYGTVSVTYKVESSNVNAVVGQDISPSSGSVKFSDGEISNTIQLQIRTDTVPENDEEFQLVLTSATQGARVINKNFTIIILANDAPISFKQREYRFDEGPGTRLVSLNVTRGLESGSETLIGSVNSVATVTYTLLQNTAQLGLDFRGNGGQNTGQVVFPVGSRYATINVEIIDDSDPEMEESFQVLLSSPTGDVVLADPMRADVFINANDNPTGILSLRSPDLISVPRAQINEDKDLSAIFTVIRTAGSFGTVSVQWEVVRNDSGSGAVDLDLSPIRGTVTFDSQVRENAIVLNIVQDLIPEPAERFKIRLLPQTVTGMAKVEGIIEGIIIIEDSDNVYGMVEFANSSQQQLIINADPRMLRFVIKRTGANVGDIYVNMTVSYKPAHGGTADVLEDTQVSAVIPAGQTELMQHIHLLAAAFIQVGGVFTAMLNGIALVAEPAIGAFNSPRLGNRNVTTITVTPAEANGEIGFPALDSVQADEFDSGPSLVQIRLTREGTSGDATVSWTLKGSGQYASYVTAGDVDKMQGTVVMPSGMSETTINITILPDNIPELDEEMTLNLTSVEPVGTQRLRPGATQRLVIIKQNDNPGGVFQFAASDQLSYTLIEGDASVEFTVVRDDGDLLQQSIQYVIINGEQDFYGATNVLTFPPGVRSQKFSVAAKPDGIPELEEVFTLRIQSYGKSNATIGIRSSVELRIAKNDNPFGVVQFQDRVIYMNESSKNVMVVATVPVKRTMGLYGAIQVYWTLDPSTEVDLRPSSGFVTFTSDQNTAFISLESVPDDITESAESFTLTLSNATGGAVIGQNFTCIVVIVANDYPISFATPVYEVEEPSETSIVISREGPTNLTLTLKYQTVDGTASALSKDYMPITLGQVTFNMGESQKIVIVRVLDDSEAEGPETFFLQVYEIIGDAVFKGPNQSNITILANDDAYGIFHFDAPFAQNVEEGSTVKYSISREGGTFGGVEVFYELYYTATNQKALNGGDFEVAEGLSVRFDKGQRTIYISITPLMDNVPENEKTYTIKLTKLKVYDGRTDVPLARIADFDNTSMVTILASDDPNGRFGFPAESKQRSIAEDYNPGMVNTSQTSLRVDRRMGIYGVVQVMWEVYSDKVAGGLPKVYDLIFLGTIPSTLMLVPSQQRPQTGTSVVSFTGKSDSLITVGSMYHPSNEEIVDGFSMCAWVQPFANTDGYILAKTNPDGSRHFYTLQIITNSLQTQLVFGYSITGSNENAFISMPSQRNIQDTRWHHVVVSVNSGGVQFYIDTNMIGSRQLASSQAIIDNFGQLTVGGLYPGTRQFSGYLQDVRVYNRQLTDDEILELYAMPAGLDVTPINGYISYEVGSRDGSINIRSIQDLEEEGDEIFTVRLLTAKGGATLSLNDNIATLTVLKSDNANGLFYFPQQCQPTLPSTEGDNITCTIARQRGDDGQVIVTWAVYQLLSGQSLLATEDFVDYTGQVVFQAGERSKTFSVQLKDDNIPEPQEVYEIRLINITTEDNLIGSTNTSGASIDSNNRGSTVTMRENDFPNGLLQFSTSLLPPLPDSPFIPPATEKPTVRVAEEAGIARLLVVRAMGYQGEVTVEWRTTDGTAKSSGKSPPDYSAAVGRLTLRDRERYGYIDITIIDNNIPEDEKSFIVTLLNPSGGAALGVASIVTVVIQPSDGAFGVFQFKDDSRGIQAEETGDSGYNIVPIKIERVGGSIGQSVVTWEVQNDRNNDIVDHSGNVTFSHGQLTADIGLKVMGDMVPELDELFVVQIVNVSRGELGPVALLRSEVTIIANDDPYGRFIIPASNRPKFVNESYIKVNINIQRLAGMYGVVEVNYTTLLPTETFSFIPVTLARANLQDFTMSAGSVRFMADQGEASFDIEVLDDVEPEEDEAVYVRLTSVKLLEMAQVRPVTNSPRLGFESETYGQIIIRSNDNANGELVLSPLSPRVPENQTEPFLFVTRYGGAFGEVTVTIKVTDGTATQGLDFVLLSPQVTLLRGQKSAPVPLRILDDTIPELSETFTVSLDQVSGGGVLGSVTTTTVIIDTSDDPNGAFEFSVAGLSVEEPDSVPRDVNITVIRTGGTVGVVTLDWVAMLDGKCPDGNNNNCGIALDDIRPTSGSIYFVSNEASRQLVISVLPDDIPEGQEDIKIRLTSVSNGGRIGTRSVFTLSIPSNDNPHGVVQFARSQYTVEERETNSQQTLQLTRTGGSYGELRVYYSTSKVVFVEGDVSSMGAGVLNYFLAPQLGGRGKAGEAVPVQPLQDPVQVCATACLARLACVAFEVYLYNNTGSCTLYDTPLQGALEISSTVVKYYVKDFVKAGELAGVHATPGEDYSVVTNGYILIPEGNITGEIPVTILADSIPELNEKFLVTLTRVDVTGAPPTAQNTPYLGELRNATVTILANDDTYGAFTVYSDSPLASENGHRIQVEEKQNLAVDLVVERQGGTIGDVSVQWTVDQQASTAVYGVDYAADGATLSFKPGESRKLISVTILDDTMPELAKNVVVRLTRVQGGAVIKYDNATIVILENDNVAGVVALSSTSLLAKEGDTVSLDVLRSPAQYGTLTVQWSILGLNGLDPTLGFLVTKGSIQFLPGEGKKSIVLDVLKDNIPEVNEEYQLYLTNVTTTGVGISGAAAFDPQLRTASITIQGSNNPHGVVQFGSDSLNVRVGESSGSVNVQVDRKFGAIGTIRVEYEIARGSVSLTNDELVYATPSLDFVAERKFLDMKDGVSSAAITVTIIDDEEPEVDEVFIVRLLSVTLVNQVTTADPPVLGSSGTVAQVIINANDGTKGVAIFAPGSVNVSVDEVSRNISLTVTRDKGTFGEVSLFFYAQSIVPGTNLGLDYKITPQEIVFLNGDKSKQIQIEIINDDIPEPDEVFEVILSNPKNGLVLGTPSRATVTILANDDAAGFVYFEKTDLVTLDEPTADTSLITVVDILIQRGPGMYGVVNVPFEIIPELESNRNDLSPMQGRVSFQNNQTSTTLKISVLDDSLPEDAERFTLRLLEPDGGAKLGTRTTRTIIINSNDSPNGLFSLYANATRLREIFVEEGVGLLQFDIVRTQGLEGQVTVDVATEPGTADSTADVNNLDLVPVQALKTSFVEDWSSFTMNNTVYILMHKPSVVRELTADIGSQGSIGAVDMKTLMFTTLFRWQGELTPVQTIETDGISGSQGFVINNVQYLVIANKGNFNRYTTYTRLYKVAVGGNLTLLQNLESTGASDVVYFMKNSVHYLVIANSQDNSGNYQVDSSIWRWDPALLRFNKVSTLRTLGARALSVFEIETKTFLAVANFYDSAQKTYQLDSKIYKFDTNDQFSQHQSIPTLGAMDVEYIKINSLDLLIFANNRDNTVSSPQKSDVYRWDVISQMFVLHDRIETNRVEKVKAFRAFDDTVYAMFANTIGSSAIFAWNVQGNKFQSVWTGSPSLSLVPITVRQQTGTLNFIAIADKNITTSPTIYQLIKVKDSDYAPRTVTMTMDAGQDILHTTMYVLQDTIPEDTETFYVTLRNPTGGAEIGLNNRIAVNILSNDNAHGIIEIAPDSLELQAQELPNQDNKVQINVLRHQGYFGHVTVKWVATGDQDGTNDITPLEGLIEFAAGQSVATISLTVRDDDIAELQEVTYIQLTQVIDSGTTLPGRGAQIGLNKTSKLTVLANDSPYGVVKWKRSAVTVNEPEGSDSNIVLYVVREQGMAGDLQVTFITSVDPKLPLSQQAVSGEDYISRQGMVILQENVTEAPVDIVIKQDNLPEAAEVFLVNITGVVLLGRTPPPGAEPSVLIPGNIVTVTIAENDNARGIVQFNVTTNIEGRIDVYEEYGRNSTVALKVSRSVGFYGPVTVSWQTLWYSRGATKYDIAPSDGTLRIEDNQQSADIVITIIDDTEPEDMELFEIQLLSPTGGAVLGPNRAVRIAILKNDSPNGLFRFVTRQVVVRESKTLTDPDGEVTLQIERVQGSEGVVHVGWRLNAEAQYDFYQPTSGEIIFAQGEKSRFLTLRTKPDTILEGEERFRVSLVTADNNADIFHLEGDAEIIVLPDPGASGTISIMPEHRTVYIGEPGESSPNYNGKTQIVLTRGDGIFGDITVSWSITPRIDGSFLQNEGTVAIADLQQKAAITLQALDDSIPEKRFTYMLQLTSATGGATLSPVTGATTATVVFVASDHPHGEFVFELPQEYLTTEDMYSVSFPVLRRAGLDGQVFVTYKTFPGTAIPQEDYFPEEGTLTFQHGQNQLFIDVQLRQDDIPEGLETFYLNLTSARLVEPSTNNYSTVAGLQLDQQPVIGSPSVKIIMIERNDNAEGTIEFAPKAVQFYVTEEQGVAKIPLIRKGGNFGAVSVLYNTYNDTAIEGMDFVRPVGELRFDDLQREATLDVSIIDDSEMENAETFKIQLVSTTGGARLGDLTMVTVVIAKSDYPNGKFGFKGQLDIIIENPPKQMSRLFTVERTGGLLGDQTVTWRIYGPNNPGSPLQSTSDIAFISNNRELTSGTLSWPDGQGGERTFTLVIKPFSSWEIEKAFIIKLENIQGSPSTVGNGEVSPTTNSTKLTILKFGHPNGIVRFDGPAQLDREVEEPEGSTTLTLQFPILRRQDTGTVGNLEVFWEVRGPWDQVPDLQPRNGSVLVPDEERSADIVLEILPDTVPELTETFQLVITKIIGGAEIDTQYNVSTFRIRYNDEPHGMFGIRPEYQTVLVDPTDLERFVRLNITRYRGQFGSVILTFTIKYDIPQSGVLLALSDGTVTFKENEGSKLVNIGIIGTGFLEVGTMFSVSLVEVQFLGSGVTSPPRFQPGETETRVQVPAIAANSKVGFKEIMAAVDEETNTCRLTVIREGVYGSLEVSWQSGFPEGQIPAGFSKGTVTPNSSTLSIAHGIEEKNFTIGLTSKLNTSELFAVQLPVAPSTTVPGGARLIPSRMLVRIEPYGLLRFADNSTQPSVSEMFGKIYLQVVRVFGSQGKVEARYRAEGLSATPNLDFNINENLAVAMEPGQTSALIMVEVIQDNNPEKEEAFRVNLTSVEKFPTDTKPSISPRISAIYKTSMVTIKESNDPYGVLNIEPDLTTVDEEYRNVTLTVKRTGGVFGRVSVGVRTVGGGERWTSLIVVKPGSSTNNTISEILGNRDRFTTASGGTDYVILDTTVEFQQDETQKMVNVTILTDDMAEPAETILVYLTQPTGGARIAAGEVDGGLKGYAVITIDKNDLSNGMIGFSQDSLQVQADEDHGGFATLKLARTGATFGDVKVSWVAKLTETSSEQEDRVLDSQLETRAGSTICKRDNPSCFFNVTLKDDTVPEEESHFVVMLESVDEDANLNPAAMFATVNVAASDYIRGLIEFTDESRVFVASSVANKVTLIVRRVKGQDYRVEVGYRTMQMLSQIRRYGVTVYPALEGEDYQGQSGTLVFEPGRQDLQYINIDLSPFLASANPLPKQFYVDLKNPTNGASLNMAANQSAILIVEPDAEGIWEIIKDKETNQLTDDGIKDTIAKLDTALQGDKPITGNEISLTEDILKDIADEGLKRKLPTQTIGQLLNLLCKLLTPDKNDATRGRSQLAAILENVAYMLVTEAQCPSPEPPSLSSLQCVHVKISAGRWPVGKIQGYQYPGQRQDEFTVPKQIPDVPLNSGTECADFHLIEYTSEQWFQNTAEKVLLSNKVISFGIKGRPSSYSDSPAVYKIHSPDRRIATRQAQCVYYDTSLRMWVSPNGVCEVTNDLNFGTDDYVVCSCNHLTHYAVKATTSDPGLVGYNVWFFIACFICMTGLLLALLAHHICSISAMFSASLLMHMCFAAMATQICYIVAAFLSSGEILVYSIGEDNYRCIVMGLFLHYFFLCQFSWMMAQAMNFWKILVLNDEHTDRKYVFFFLFGWGAPVVIIAVFYVVTYNLYKYVYSMPYDFIYGDVNNNGAICFVSNAYAGLAGVILPVLLMLVAVIIVFVKAFQVRPQWQAYDDIYRGRYNISELRTMLLFWGVIVITWLWGGLHLVYGQLWMLIIFCIFNILQGLMAFILYSMLRNPCLAQWFGPQRASSYSMAGHMFDPSQTQTIGLPVGTGQYQFHPTTLDVTSLKGSRASLLNESWERDSMQGSRTTRSTMKVKRTLPQNGNLYIEPPVYHQNTISDSKDFDDLLYALKTGGSFTPSDGNSADSERGSDTSSNIDKYELRRIDIADTHL